MSILEKLLEIILEFLRGKREKKVEDQEIESVKIEQEQETIKKVKSRKKKTVQKPKEDNFFND